MPFHTGSQNTSIGGVDVSSFVEQVDLTIEPHTEVELSAMRVDSARRAAESHRSHVEEARVALTAAGVVLSYEQVEIILDTLDTLDDR